MGSSHTRRTFLKGSLAGAAALAIGKGAAAQGKPLKIGMPTSFSYPHGKSMINGAQMAVDEINAKGGVLGRKLELLPVDDKAATAEAARVVQRLVESDGVEALVGAWSSEVAIALLPWVARYKIPLITTGASTTAMTRRVHDDFQNLHYVFRAGPVNSDLLAQTVIDFYRDVAKPAGVTTAGFMIEDVEWSRDLQAILERDFEKQSGIEVKTKVRYARDANDFTPMFLQLQQSGAKAIVTGMAHTGLAPTVQWAQMKLNLPLGGIHVQAQDKSFFDRSHGAAETAFTWAVAIPNAKITAKTVPFAEGYARRFPDAPLMYTGYVSYDGIYVLKEAVERANSTKADDLVRALEATDHPGTTGRIQFYGKADAYTHDVRYGPGLAGGIYLQWQKGKQEVVWPTNIRTAPFVKPA